MTPTDAGDGKVVLVVTDEATLEDSCRTGFPPGYDIRFASDARVALETMKYLTPAMVIADISTGSAGGYNLRKEMQQDGRLAGVPILMLIDRAQDRWLAKEAGADRVHTKPIDTGTLIAEAEALLS